MKLANPCDHPKVPLQDCHHLAPWNQRANKTRKSRMEVTS